MTRKVTSLVSRQWSAYLRLLETTPVRGTYMPFLVGSGYCPNFGLVVRCGESFESRMFGKTEQELPPCDIAAYEMVRHNPPPNIISSCAEVPLWYLHQLAWQQSDGEAGPLLTSGFSNVAPVTDQEGFRCLFDARRIMLGSKTGWAVYLRDLDEWPDIAASNFRLITLAT